MSVVVLIRGREAIPVRAIPYVTGWDVSPDMVTKSLANSPNGIRLDWLTAYQYHADGSHTPILPKEWDGIDDRLRGLSASSKAKSNNNDVARTKWLKKSIPILPAGVFVWRDELEKSWRRFCWLVENRKGERPNDGMLNFSPMIPTELFEQVCEGFTFPRAVTDTAQQVPDEAQEQTTSSGAPEKAGPADVPAAVDEEAATKLPVSTIGQQNKRPLGQQRYQEAEILRVISELGYIADALPRWIPGKAGVKAEVRGKLPTMTDSVFRLAWERLRADGKIKEGNRSFPSSALPQIEG